MPRPNGDPVKGQTCPRCGEVTVVYNGNYFCDNAACDWVMPERMTARSRQIIKAYLIQKWLEADAIGDEDEKKRLGQYLIEYADE